MDHPVNIKTNIFAFIGIKLPEIFPSFRICWNYSATSHSKGAVDGVGGTIKHLATRTIITRKAIVNNADSLLKAVQDKTKTNLAVMEEILSDMEIPSLWEKVNAVPGTKHIHRIEPSRVKQQKDLLILRGHFLYYSPTIVQQKSYCYEKQQKAVGCW